MMMSQTDTSLGHPLVSRILSINDCLMGAQVPTHYDLGRPETQLLPSKDNIQSPPLLSSPLLATPRPPHSSSLSRYKFDFESPIGPPVAALPRLCIRYTRRRVLELTLGKCLHPECVRVRLY